MNIKPKNRTAMVPIDTRIQEFVGLVFDKLLK